MRSIVSTSATRCSRQRRASTPNGRLVRLTTKPATSAASITRFPIASPRSRTRWTASGALCTAAITSTSRITGAGLKKCMPTTRSGRGAALAIAVMGIDDVFEASTASGASSPSLANSSRLSSRRSGAASTITSQPARSSSAGAGSGASNDCCFRSHRATIFAIAASMSAIGSWSRLSAPAWAASCAMPAPMVPAPTTPTLMRASCERVDAGQRSADDQPLDLRGALVERGDAHVAERALDGMVVDVAGAAVDLDRRVGAPLRGLGRVELRDRRLGGVRLAGVLQPARAPGEQARRVGLDLHLGEHALHELEGGDRAVELLALGGVTHRFVEHVLTDAGRPGGHAEAPGVQRAHRHLEPVADLAEDLVVAREDVIEPDGRGVRAMQPHLPVDLGGLEAVLIGVDQKAGEAAVLLLGIGLGEDQGDLGVVAHRDPHLGAVDL